MKERQSRLKLIKSLIKSNSIESQDVLLSLLQKEGYDVTQATLSRDLKLLKVGKVPDGKSGYMYALPDDEENSEAVPTCSCPMCNASCCRNSVSWANPWFCLISRAVRRC